MEEMDIDSWSFEDIENYSGTQPDTLTIKWLIDPDYLNVLYLLDSGEWKS